jgi:hypothetical protein
MDDPDVQQTATDAEPETKPETASSLKNLQQLASELKEWLTAETLDAFKKMLESAPEPEAAPVEKASPMVHSVVKDGLRVMVHPEPESTKE